MNDPRLTLIVLLVFAAALALVYGLNLLWREMNQARGQQVKRRIRLLSAASDESDYAKRVSLERTELNSPLDEMLLGLPRLHHLDRFLEQSGVSFGPAVAMALTLLGAVVGAMLLMLVFRNMSLVTAVLGALAGTMIPWFILNRRRRKRLDRLVSQLPDTLDFIARSMRAGNPFTSALKSAAEEVPQPLADELSISFEEINYGLDLEEAMHNLAERVDCEEVRLFVTAVLVQKSTGGNLAEILNRISGLLRDRIRTRGEIRIQAAEMKLSANILIVLPFFVAGMLQILNPEYLPVLLESRLGNTLILIQMGLMLTGYLIMRRMINFRI